MSAKAQKENITKRLLIHSLVNTFLRLGHSVPLPNMEGKLQALLCLYYDGIQLEATVSLPDYSEHLRRCPICMSKTFIGGHDQFR